MKTASALASGAQLAATANRDNFASVRLVAAILVVYGHSFPLTGGEGPGYLGSAVSTLAVKVFFVISGYLISESWVRDPHLLRYLTRRVLRIFPALAVLCLLTVFVVGPWLSALPLADYFASQQTWRYLTNVVLLPNYGLPEVFSGNIYSGAVNGSLWTLPVEFSMYLLVPAILVLPFARHAIFAVAVLSSVASVWFTRMQIPDVPPVIWGSNLINALEMVPYFFWGAVYRIWVPRRTLSVQVAVLMLVVLPLLVVGWPSSEVVALILLPYATLAFGFAAPPALGWVDRYGDFSYGAYLYGFLCQQIVGHFLPLPGNHWANFGFAVIPTLLLGLLSWKLIEKPALQLKPHRRSP